MFNLLLVLILSAVAAKGPVVSTTLIMTIGQGKTELGKIKIGIYFEVILGLFG
jgi:hypothetical protein